MSPDEIAADTLRMLVEHGPERFMRVVQDLYVADKLPLSKVEHLLAAAIAYEDQVPS